MLAKFSFGVKHDEHDHLFCVCFAASAFNVLSHLSRSTDFVVAIEPVDGTCLANENWPLLSTFFDPNDVDGVTFVVDVDGVVVAVDANAFLIVEFITIGWLNL